jgi:TfoX/Sxy family transcriptional regulator of competence genes
MAYDQAVAERIRVQIEALQPYTEKRMFGGIAFFVNGNMACGIIGDKVMVRVGREGYEEALARPHAGPFDMTGRAMKGWVSISPDGYASDEGLRSWVRQGVGFAATLPPK